MAKVAKPAARAPAGPSNPMQSSRKLPWTCSHTRELMLRAPQCTARSKRSGVRCLNRAVRGHHTCRMHSGGVGGAPHGVGNGNYKSGDFTLLNQQIMRRLSQYQTMLRRFDKAERTPLKPRNKPK
jgi:hypothetical protein